VYLPFLRIVMMRDFLAIADFFPSCIAMSSRLSNDSYISYNVGLSGLLCATADSKVIYSYACVGQRLQRAIKRCNAVVFLRRQNSNDDFHRAMLCIRGTSHGPHVCVCHKLVFYRNGWTNRTGFWHVSFLPPVLHCVKRKFGYLQNKGTSFWNFVLNSGLKKFRHGISIVETCYQLNSKKVDAQSVINWAVVGQLSR